MHTTHGDKPLIVVAPTQVIRRSENAWRTVSGLPERANLLSFSDMADAVEAALNIDGPPEYLLIEVMGDVEKITLPAA